MASEDMSSPALLASGSEPRLKSGNNLIPALLEKLEVPELRALLEIRKQGWEDKNVDNTFSARRVMKVNPATKAQRVMVPMTKNIMREINGHASFLRSSGSYRFLDLGCCPGGFASYILSFNPEVRGMGVSLPVRQGGHQFSLERHLRSRMEFKWADLTYYKLHPSAHELRGTKLAPLPKGCEEFDLVILDGHYLRFLYLTPMLEQPEAWDNHRLYISQVIIALRTVKLGGTIVMKLSHPEWTSTAQSLYLLDVLSADLKTLKPSKAHAKHGTFYAIAKGVGLGVKGSSKEEYLRRYEEHWYDISFGGEDGKGRESTWSDINFVVSYEELVDGYLERVAELGRRPWVVQTNALKNMTENNRRESSKSLTTYLSDVKITELTSHGPAERDL